MRILLADGFLVYRKGMAAVLSRSPGITVAGEVSDADSAAAAADLLHPDLVILAADLPGGALMAARRIKTAHPEVRIVLLVEVQGDAAWYSALGAPADNYLPRAAGVRELLAALHPPVATR